MLVCFECGWVDGFVAAIFVLDLCYLYSMGLWFVSFAITFKFVFVHWLSV